MITNDRLGEHTRVAHIYKDIYMAVGLRPWRVAHKYKDIFMSVGLRPWGVSGHSQRLIKETDTRETRATLKRRLCETDACEVNG